MAGIDNRIVTMQFNNAQFEQNAKTSLSTLGKLKESMNFSTVAAGAMKGLGVIDGALTKIGLRTPFAPFIKAATSGLGVVGSTLDRIGLKNPFSSGVQGASELQRAAQTTAGPAGMGALEGAVTGVSAKFIALTTIAVTALTNITNKAIDSGAAFLKSFTIQPILDGLNEYETNLKAIQTVQANTDRPLPEINSALEELNRYSDQTIYNFSEMAKNVGTFTAAGVDLETSVSSIKGIANLAALSGSSSQQAATAMYQLSQAISSGRVGLQDWNSVVNAGMGGKKLQNALAQTAIAMGEIDAAAVKGVESGEQLKIMGQSFRESIMAQPGQESWLSSEILVNTLSTMDGRFSAVALAAEETENGLQKYSKAQIAAKIATARTALETKNGVRYTDEQFAALQNMSTAAFEAATKVKTLGQVFDIAKETLASGYSASFVNIFGNLDQAKKLFTGMSDGLSKIIKDNARARNVMLAAWSAGGGRTMLIDGLKNAWEALLGILGPIKEGFRDIFPAQTAEGLIELSARFKEFTEGLIPSKATMADIRDIAGGVFAVFSIIGQVIGGVVSGFKALFDTLGAGNGNFLDFAAGIGQTIQKFSEFLKESGIITAFFEGLAGLLSVPLSLLSGLGGAFSKIFAGFNADTAAEVGDTLDAVGQKLSGLQVVGERIRNFFTKVGEFFGNLGSHIGTALVGIGDVIAGAFTADTFGSTLDVINTTLLGGLVLMIKSFFSKGVDIDLTGGLFDGIKETLGEATGAFENMQNTLKADILLKLGFAIGVMAGSLLILSTIDPAAMTTALVAMTAGFGILIGAMAALMKFLGAAGLIQMYVVTTAMTKMALAILLMSLALKTLASLNFGEMIRGIVGLSLMMKILTKAMVPLAAGSKGMSKAAFSIILLGVAINILAVALKIFATMNWEEMIKGLAGLAASLAILVVALKFMPPMQASALGLIALGVAVNLLAVALQIFASMSLKEMGKGLLALAGSLAVIAGAMRVMPKTMLLQSVALVAVAGALVVMAGALKLMGAMSGAEIAKSLILLGGAMAILAIGLRAIGVVGSIGAIGLLAAAGALAIMAPILITLGTLSWETIIKGLVGIAGMLAIFGVAGYVLAPVIPIILGLGAAMLIFGAGLALAGTGAFLAATAFGLVVAAGIAGASVLAEVLTTIVGAIPPALAAFGKGIVQFAVAIGQGAPKIAAAFGKVLTNILNAVIKNAPKLAQAFNAMLDAGLRVLVSSIPKIANAGLKLILGFLTAIDQNIDGIVTRASSIIQKFLAAMGRELPKITDSGAKLVISFVNGVADAIRNNSEQMGAAGANLGFAIIEGFGNAITGSAGVIKDKLVGIAQDALQAAKDFFKIGGPSKTMRDEVGRWIPIGILDGVRKASPELDKGMSEVGRRAVGTLQASFEGIGNALNIDPNFNPTVTPVLDLSRLTMEANRMSSILATSPISADVSYRNAASISADTLASADALAAQFESGGGGDTYVTLEQHNHSPEPLDSVTVYRNGKSLISLAKEALKK